MKGDEVMTELPARIDLLHLIGDVCGVKYQRMMELLDALGLYQGQPSVLHALWASDGMPQSELAERLNRSPSTITKTVQRMERAGFVERRPDSGDERLSLVYLTEAGRAVKSDVERVWQQFAAEAFAGFDDDELRQFSALLERLHRNIEHRGELI